MRTQLVRRRLDRMIGGVCSGLGTYFGIDPVIVRLVFVVLALTKGISLLLYPVLWLIMPEEAVAPPLPPDARFDPQTGLPLAAPLNQPTVPAEATATPSRQRNRNLAVVLLGIGAVVLLSNMGEVLHINVGDFAFPLLLVGFGVYMLRSERHH